MHFLTTIINLLDQVVDGAGHTQLLAKFAHDRKTDVERALHELKEAKRIVQIGTGDSRWYYSAKHDGTLARMAAVKNSRLTTDAPPVKRGRPPKPTSTPPEKKAEPMPPAVKSPDQSPDVPVFLKPNMSNTLSPFEIGIVMHYVCLAGDHEVVRNPPPIWDETLARLFALGLLEQDDAEHDRVLNATERAHVYIKEGLCKLPLPVQVWAMPSLRSAA